MGERIEQNSDLIKKILLWAGGFAAVSTAIGALGMAIQPIILVIKLFTSTLK